MRCETLPDTTSQNSRFGVVVSVLAVLVLAVLAGGCAGTSFDHEPASADAGDRYRRVMRVAAAAEADGDAVAAAGLYESARALAPDRPEPVMALAKLAAALGDADGAARFWRTAVALEPDAPAARRGLGAALLALDEPTHAARQFQAAIAADPADAQSYNGLGVSLDLLGRHDEARRAYRTGLDLTPDASGLTNNLALSLALTRHFDAAINALLTIADDPEAGSRVRQNLALVYALAGRQDEAAATAARDLPPREAQANLAFYQALQGLSGRGLAAAVFHANLETAPASASDAASREAPSHSAAADLDPPGLADAANVECFAADPVEVEIGPPPPVADVAAPAAVGPTRSSPRGWLALAEPVRAARAAVRGLRFAWTAPAGGVRIDAEWIAPPTASAGAATTGLTTGLAAGGVVLHAATAAVTAEPLSVPADWRPQPVLVDVAEAAPQPAAGRDAEREPVRPDAAVALRDVGEASEQATASLWDLVQIGDDWDRQAPAAGLGVPVQAEPAGSALAVVQAGQDPQPARVAVSVSVPVEPPSGPVERRVAPVGLIASRAREGP